MAGDDRQFTQGNPPGQSAGQQFGGPATAPPGYFPPAKPKRNPFRVAYFSALGVVFVVGIGVVAFGLLSGNLKSSAAQVDGNGNVTKSGGLDLRNLTTGQCFNEPSTADQNQVGGVEAIPCAQPHDAQVIGFSMLTDDSYDEATVKSEAGDACQQTSNGPTVDQTKLDSSANVIDFIPTAQSWANLDRRVTCAVDNGTGTKLTGSVLK
ncbi:MULTISPECIES: septum formation family protein [unclassified Kitasatospora]|uniref:septum formation family protein n=1 Tax=unclassified Kitasatospora TaxID=2633591 RepID=UPI002474CF85|nr:septum formation family protein [Kitasatospora sp. MAP12-44]